MPQLPRPPRITIAAAIAAIGSGLAISIAVFTLLAGSATIGGANAPSRALLVVLPLLLLAAGFWGLATARGLLRLQPWARASILAFSILLAFLGAMGTFFILSTKIPAPAGITSQEFDVIRSIVTIVYFAFLALGVWWLVEFNSPNMKSLFRNRNEPLPVGADPEDIPEPEEEPQPVRPNGFARQAPVKLVRPLSITIIAWYLLAGTASSAVQVLLGVPASIFGMTLAGPPASLLYLAMFAAQAYLGVSLLQLLPLSRILAVYFFLFGFVNTALFVGLPGREARLAAMVRSFPSAVQPPPGAPPAMAWWLPLISAGIGTALPIWFLITRKDAFPPREPK